MIYILTPLDLLLLLLLLLIYAYVLHLHFKYFKVEYMILFAETHIKIYCPLGGYKYAFTLRPYDSPRCHLLQTKHRYRPSSRGGGGYYLVPPAIAVDPVDRVA